MVRCGLILLLFLLLGLSHGQTTTYYVSTVTSSTAGNDCANTNGITLQITGTRGAVSTSLTGSFSLGQTRNFTFSASDVGIFTHFTLTTTSTDTWKPNSMIVSNHANYIECPTIKTTLVSSTAPSITIDVVTLKVNVPATADFQAIGNFLVTLTDTSGTQSFVISGLETNGKAYSFKRGFEYNGVMTFSISTTHEDGLFFDWISLNSRRFFAKYRYNNWIDSGNGPNGPSSATLTTPFIAVIKAADLNLNLPDSATTTATYNVAGLPTTSVFGTIMIGTSIAHTNFGDLAITITNPTATSVVLSNKRGGSNNDIFLSTLFSDFSTNSVSSYSFTNNVAVPHIRAETGLSPLLTGNPNGNWIFKIVDNAAQDTGTLRNFYIVFLEKAVDIDTFSSSNTALFSNGAFDGEDLRLTSSTNGQCGQGFLLNNFPFYQNSMQRDFQIYFSFYIDQLYNGGADGMTLMLSAANPTVCYGGENMGFSDNANTVAIEIDTYENDIDDTSSDHIGIDIGSADSLAYKTFSYSFNDAQMYMWVDYRGGSNSFELRLTKSTATKPTNADLTYTLNLLSNIGSSSTLKIGFSGSTGARYQRQRVYFVQATFECYSGCENGGTCTDGNVCTCPTGYTGFNCHIEIDECASSNPCLNGGLCIDQVASTSCKCDGTGYTGTTCNTDIDECSTSANNCTGLAYCNNIPGSFTCVCPSGYYWSGSTCVDYNECNNENGGNDCSSFATCTNNAGSFSCACNSAYFGNGKTCTACDCQTGASGSSCNSTGYCLCQTNFAGQKCDDCVTGRYGPFCEECPSCGNGVCRSGINGDGKCTCDSGWAYDNVGSCTICDTNRFGVDCQGTCPNCNQGTCSSGKSGNGQCNCETGWKNNGTSYCSICETGYILSEGQCKKCHSTCSTCDSPLENSCTSCPPSLTLSNGYCNSSCPIGQFSDNNICFPCNSTCYGCIGPLSSNCTSCTDDKVFDFGYCRDSCSQSTTYNNSGVCTECSNQCKTCIGSTSSDCLTCYTDFFWDRGKCLTSCADENYYASNSICYECNPSCASCNGPGSSNCLSCYNGKTLKNNQCIDNCPSDEYEQNKICYPCYGNCDSCKGPAYFDCTSCNSIFPYLDNGICTTRCSASRYVPEGSTVCIDCQCYGHTRSCSDETGECFNCKGNTEGDHCQYCKSGFMRTSGNLNDSCIACQCNGHSGTCDVGTGVCATCSGNTMGDNCEFCKPGYKRLTGGPSSECIPCECNGNSNSCDVDTGECLSCSGNTIGHNCETCLTGYTLSFKPPSPCELCSCNGHSTSCHNETGVCFNCQNNSSGNQCEQCASGFTRYSTNTSLPCVACNCNGFSNTCDYVTGVCSDCQKNTTGDFCEMCSAGYKRTSGIVTDLCEPCECNGHSNICEWETGNCNSCKENTQGPNCNECMPGFMRLSGKLEDECIPCECNEHSNTCNQLTGLCSICGDYTTGDYCESCLPGSFRISGNLTEPCEICDCNGRSPSCEVTTGVCLECAGGFIGNNCELCPDGLLSNGTDCIVSSGETSGPKYVAPLVATLVSLCCLIVFIAVFVCFMQKRHQKKLKIQVEAAIQMSSANLQDFERFTAVSDSRSIRSEVTKTDVTMLNTMVDGQISLPGYLKMDYSTDIRVEKFLAQGGGGSIAHGVIINSDLKAKYPTFADNIAIKTVASPGNMPVDQALLQFHQEVSVLNYLSFHPNVIRLLGYTEDPNTLITPLYQGDLDALIHIPENHKYSSLDLIDIVSHIVSAIDAMHSSGIAHRDIKPKNFLLEVRKLGQTEGFGRWSKFPYRIKICDFGVSFVDSELVDTLVKFHNHFGMSVRYAAPEVFVRFSEGRLTPSLGDYQMSDIYSFGICLWELLHRVDPWGTTTLEEIKENLMNEERPPFTIDSNDDPKIDFLKQLTDVCWSQIPSSRPFSKQIISRITLFMEEESKPRKETPILQAT